MRVRNPLELGALIRLARTDQGLSQAELGTMVGVRQAKISDIERGQTGVRISLVLQIINALKLTIDITSNDDHPQSILEGDLEELDAIANTGLKKA
ncbi:MAG: helix-turn-helix domain-containing protein [Hyphomonadaceae bacterium]